jgi:hypothetical protein
VLELKALGETSQDLSESVLAGLDAPQVASEVNQRTAPPTTRPEAIESAVGVEVEARHRLGMERAKNLPVRVRRRIYENADVVRGRDCEQCSL